jgi:hypothetical protein
MSGGESRKELFIEVGLLFNNDVRLCGLHKEYFQLLLSLVNKEESLPIVNLQVNDVMIIHLRRFVIVLPHTYICKVNEHIYQ